MIYFLLQWLSAFKNLKVIDNLFFSCLPLDLIHSDAFLWKYYSYIFRFVNEDSICIFFLFSHHIGGCEIWMWASSLQVFIDIILRRIRASLLRFLFFLRYFLLLVCFSLKQFSTFFLSWKLSHRWRKIMSLITKWVLMTLVLFNGCKIISSMKMAFIYK